MSRRRRPKNTLSMLRMNTLITSMRRVFSHTLGLIALINYYRKNCQSKKSSMMTWMIENAQTMTTIERLKCLIFLDASRLKTITICIWSLTFCYCVIYWEIYWYLYGELQTDPSFYYTAPGLSWDAMLLETGVEF